MDLKWYPNAKILSNNAKTSIFKFYHEKRHITISTRIPLGGWTFSQNVSSPALTVWDRPCFEDSEQKVHLMNYWINQWIIKVFIEQPRLHWVCKKEKKDWREPPFFLVLSWVTFSFLFKYNFLLVWVLFGCKILLFWVLLWMNSFFWVLVWVLF